MGRTAEADNEPLAEWLTTDEVAIRFKVPVNRVTRMIREGRLKAVKKGWVHLIHVNDLPTSWPPPLA